MLIEDKIFNKVDFAVTQFDKGEYEYCKFSHCNFSDANFSENKFLECEFDSCNLSMTKLGMTVFIDTSFYNCKMTGLNFEHCSDFGFSIFCSNCILDYSIFYKKLLKNCSFKNCSFIESDFTEANLTALHFDKCDFSNAKFENTIMERCDFSTSFNYILNPEANRIKKARFSLAGIPGLLTKYEIDITT